MCRVLKVHRSGFYAWLKQPVSRRDKEDQRLSGLVKQSWLESGCVYGSTQIHADLREMKQQVNNLLLSVNTFIMCSCFLNC